LNLITKLLEARCLNHSNELSVLKEIRNIIIHRSGKLLGEERSLNKKLGRLKIGNSYIAKINEENNFITIKGKIVHKSLP